jgi:hypothetical protein
MAANIKTHTHVQGLTLDFPHENTVPVFRLNTYQRKAYCTGGIFMLAKTGWALLLINKPETLNLVYYIFCYMQLGNSSSLCDFCVTSVISYGASLRCEMKGRQNVTLFSVINIALF